MRLGGMGMAPELMVLDSEAEVAMAVARRLAATVAQMPTAVLGLATGGTPMPIYKALIALAAEKRLSFRMVRSFNLDEYVGLSASHPASFAHFMRENLFDHIDIDLARARVPNGVAADLGAEAASYERAIAEAGGIGLQILGIGANGHIGFNEPGSAFNSRTRVVDLAEATRQANSSYFPAGESVPGQALTMGIGTILNAREIVLAATGAHKAPAIAATLAGPITIDCPASALRLHARVTIICDRAAAAQLP